MGHMEWHKWSFQQTQHPRSSYPEQTYFENEGTEGESGMEELGEIPFRRQGRGRACAATGCFQ